jgi:hypothetical protein
MKGCLSFDLLWGIIVCLLLQMLLVAAGLDPEALVAEGDKYMASKDYKWAKQRFEAARAANSEYPGGRYMSPTSKPQTGFDLASHFQSCRHPTVDGFLS